MAQKLAGKRSRSRSNSSLFRNGSANSHERDTARRQILRDVTEVRILDPEFARAYIQTRQEQGIDQCDEVWEGVYIVPPLANNRHQSLVAALCGILFNVITLEARGTVFPGANVSDRRVGWHRRFRAPDIVVVLKESGAIDCSTHLMRGPDFLVEVQTPGDETELKIPFYSEISVRELLVVHRDSRQLRLYRHNGKELVLIKPGDFQGGKWLVSQAVPLAFRRRALRSGPVTEVSRTDETPGFWSF